MALVTIVLVPDLGIGFRALELFFIIFLLKFCLVSFPINMRTIFLLDGKLQDGGLSESKDNHDSIIFRYTFPYNENDINSIHNELRYY